VPGHHSSVVGWPWVRVCCHRGDSVVLETRQNSQCTPNLTSIGCVPSRSRGDLRVGPLDGHACNRDLSWLQAFGFLHTRPSRASKTKPLPGKHENPVPYINTYPYSHATCMYATHQHCTIKFGSSGIQEGKELLASHSTPITVIWLPHCLLFVHAIGHCLVPEVSALGLAAGCMLHAVLQCQPASCKHGPAVTFPTTTSFR
jgi:hypothetical protein